ncbi:interferon alpha-inducible protein 6 isoform X2 [Artibeus jamaicensis]|uniref:interferon alpha-inducible protein 6 isoform X2 n=1 Tax=Artibeus jamaicensis TaxID=9417 RepID=UPI00235AC567|nr:interferon alpha-inducible protein 6 isoform X2 [Artibeus jamaicensis]
MRQKVISLFLCYLLLYTCSGVEAGTRKDSQEDSNSGFWDALTYVAVGGGLLAMGLPALGFGAAGIAANSWAASLMSWSAVANGGGVPAGGLVATLQSLVPRRCLAHSRCSMYLGRIETEASKEMKVGYSKKLGQVPSPKHPDPPCYIC